MKKLVNRYKEIIMYIFFGGCTTFINIIIYYIFAHLINLSTVFSNVIAWVCAVLFAYITNKIWVFKSEVKDKIGIVKEMLSFFACRIITGLIDLAIMYIFVDVLSFNDIIIKIIANIIVIILNYVASKLIIFSKNKDSLINIKEIEVLIFFCLLSFIILLESPIHPWITKTLYIDQSVFSTIGILMHKGFVMYRDMFDHKGPLIYLYYFLGTGIDSYKGVWYIEYINLVITLYYMYKIATLKCNRIVSIIICIISTITFHIFFDYGNLVEEYALPFISLSLYYILDYFTNNKVNNIRILLCGISFGAVMLLRQNMIGLWLIFSIAILIKCIKEKKNKELLNFIIYFILGFIIINIPFIIYLYCNNSLTDFFEDYYLFNFVYTKYSETGFGLSAKLSALLFYSFHILIVISIAILIIMYIIEKKKIYLIYLAYIIISLLLISISGNLYPHYGLVLVPISIYPLSCFYNYFYNKKIYKHLMYLLFIYLVGVFVIPMYAKLIISIPNTYRNRNVSQINEDYLKISEIIKEKTNENDKISVYGSLNILYILSDRVPATKYSYQYPIIYKSNKIKEDYFNELEKEMPKIIVIRNGMFDNYIKDFLDNNNYKLINGNIYSDRVYELQ